MHKYRGGVALCVNMGAGASLPSTVDKPTAKSFAGDRFDEKAFDAAAKNGIVSKCAILGATFDQRVKDAIAAESSSEEAAQLAAKSFWEDQEHQPLWMVPLSGDSQFSRRCGLLAAIERARGSGKTPLLIDNSKDRLIDTLYSYQQVQVLEAKRLILDEAKGMARSEVLERARTQLVKAIRFGQVLYVRMGNTACDFCGKYNGADTLPLEIFDAKAVAELNEQYGSAPADVADEKARHVGANLWGAQSPFGSVLREDDAVKGAFVPRRGFEVVLCTHLGAQDFAELLAGKVPMEKLQPIAGVELGRRDGGGLDAAASSSDAAARTPPTVEELLAPVEESRQEAERLNTKPAKDALEAALRKLLSSVGVSELPEGDAARLDEALAANAHTYKTALLRPLNTCAAYGGFACMPSLAEQARRLLVATPAKGAAGLFEVLCRDMEVCKEARELQAVQETLELMLGQGRLRKVLGDAFDGGVELPAAHKEACKAAMLRAQKRHEALRAWRRAQQLKAANGFTCVRFEDRNEAFDVVDRHDERGYTLDVLALEKAFALSALYELGVTHALVQEDVGTHMDVRAWMARPAVTDRDGPKLMPDATATFIQLKPDAQYRLECHGTRKKVETPKAGVELGGAFGKLGLLDDDAGMVALTCGCQVGKPCGACTATAAFG